MRFYSSYRLTVFNERKLNEILFRFVEPIYSFCPSHSVQITMDVRDGQVRLLNSANIICHGRGVAYLFLFLYRSSHTLSRVVSFMYTNRIIRELRSSDRPKRVGDALEKVRRFVVVLTPLTSPLVLQARATRSFSPSFLSSLRCPTVILTTILPCVRVVFSRARETEA